MRTPGEALTELCTAPAPSELRLCDCSLAAQHGWSLGLWLARGVEDADLRDNSALGGEGIAELVAGILQEPKEPAGAQPRALRRLRLDGCALGDEGIEALGRVLVEEALP